MIYSIEIRETRTFAAEIRSTSRDGAIQEMRDRIKYEEIQPHTVDVEVFEPVYCAACEEQHMGPVCKKPAEHCRGNSYEHSENHQRTDRR